MALSSKIDFPEESGGNTPDEKELPSPEIVITAFGGFSIAAKNPETGETLFALSDGNKSAAKTFALLEYLIFSNKNSVTFDELIDVLWPDSEKVSNPLAALRLLVHRTRAELDNLGRDMGAELLVRQDKAYSWNRTANMRIDTEMFERLYESAQRANALDRVDLLTEAARLYTGRFLPGMASQQWVMILDTYYHSKYLMICEEAVSLLEGFGRTRDIIELCGKAVLHDPYAEQLHIALLKALVNINAHNEAREHYKKVTEMLMNELSVTPSRELTDVYKLIMQGMSATHSDINTIRESLSEGETDGGAYFTELEVFKQLYRVKSRECYRSGQAMQLGLITITPSGGKTPTLRAQNTMMRKLGENIKKSLRQGDVYTRFSVIQYLILLQSSNFENGHAVLARIEKNVRASRAGGDFIMQCSLLPIIPQELL